MIRKEVHEIQKNFNCSEIEAVNILLQLIAQDEFEQFTEFEEQTLPKAA